MAVWKTRMSKRRDGIACVELIAQGDRAWIFAAHQRQNARESSWAFYASSTGFYPFTAKCPRSVFLNRASLPFVWISLSKAE